MLQLLHPPSPSPPPSVAVIRALMQLSRTQNSYGLKPPRGSPKNIMWQRTGMTMTAEHHRIVRRNGVPVREPYGVIVQIMRGVDLRVPKVIRNVRRSMKGIPNA